MSFQDIKDLMIWNGYPNGVRNFLIKKLKTKYIDSSTSDAANHDTDDDMLHFYISLSRSNLVYEVACPGCGKTYIGMTQSLFSTATE